MQNYVNIDLNYKYKGDKQHVRFCIHARQMLPGQ